MATKKSKGFAMSLLQLAIGIVSLIVGLATISKESAPYIQKAIEKKQQEDAAKRAYYQAQMNIQYFYRGNDGTYRYYSDSTGVYWYRTNIEGIVEYARNPSVVR